MQGLKHKTVAAERYHDIRKLGGNTGIEPIELF